MPQVDVKTRLRPVRPTGKKPRPREWLHETELVIEIGLLPRGSGNRKLARSIAAAAKQHPKLRPHLKRVRAGSSKVWVVLRPSAALMRIMMEWNQDRLDEVDVPGQLPLFGGPAPA